MLGLQNEREWVLFCQRVLRKPGLAADERFASNARRSANRNLLRPLIVEAFAELTVDEVLQRLDEAQIANARVNDMHDVWRHPQLRARGRWTEVPTPNGPIPALLPPGRSNRWTPRMDAVPGLGQHTEAILAELGWPQEQVERLRTTGSI
jgi:itaconate CoA-transferase